MDRGISSEKALDGALLVGLAGLAGGLCFVAPLAIGVAMGVALLALCLRSRTSRVALLIASLAFFSTAIRTRRAILAFEGARASVVENGPWPSTCTLEGVVASSPVMTGDVLRLDLEVAQGRCGAHEWKGRMTLSVSDARGASTLARGDEVSAIAQLAPLHRFWNEGTGDPRPTQTRRRVILSGGADEVTVRARGRGVTAQVDRLRSHVRQRIVATFRSDTSAMARALVLGEEDLTNDDRTAFRRSGLSHLLAVSGMHLVVVASGFVAALRAILARVPALASRIDVMRIAAAIGIPCAWAFSDFAGGSGSAIRAAWMMSIGLLASVVGRRPDAVRAFGGSMIAMTLVDPFVAYDLSFVLSVAATGGILALGTAIEEALATRFTRVPRPLVRSLAATTSASVACAPILAGMTTELPIAGLVANLIAVPLGEVAALPLCIGHALLAGFPWAERGTAVAASGALALVRWTAHRFSTLPGATLSVPSPTKGELIVLALGSLGATGLAIKPRKAIVAMLMGLFAFESLARWRGAPKGALRVTFVDVGQGDAALVDLPDGRLMLVDGGGLVGSPLDVGERAVLPLLRARRRSRIDIVALSHPHPDHFMGLASVVGRVDVGEFWDTGQGETEATAGAYAEVLATLRAGGVPVLGPSDLCGKRDVGGASFDVLAPCPSASSDRGPNDNSLVFRIRYGDRAVLFVGDAERAEEDGLLREPERLRADVLKVGHHGSRTSSSPAMLEAVAPSVAVISCGVRNRFGHPHATTLLTLAKAAARVWRTDRDGTVTVTLERSPASLAVTTME